MAAQLAGNLVLWLAGLSVDQSEVKSADEKVELKAASLAVDSVAPWDERMVERMAE